MPRWPTSSRRTGHRPVPRRPMPSGSPATWPMTGLPMTGLRMTGLRMTGRGATSRPGRGWLPWRAGSCANLMRTAGARLTRTAGAHLTTTAGATRGRLRRGRSRRARCPGRAGIRIAPGHRLARGHRPPGPLRRCRQTGPALVAGTGRGRRARGAFPGAGLFGRTGWSARPGRCGAGRADPDSSRGVRARGRGGRRSSHPPGRSRRACGVTRVSSGTSARRTACRHRASERPPRHTRASS